MWRKIWEVCCSCCMKSQKPETDSTELLTAPLKGFPGLQYYTVRRISSFGRVPSLEDVDGSYQDLKSLDKKDVKEERIHMKEHITSLTLATSQRTEQDSQQKVISPATKRRKKWFKALPVLRVKSTKPIKIASLYSEDEKITFPSTPTPQIAISSPDLVKDLLYTDNESGTLLENKLKHAATLDDVSLNTLSDNKSQWLKSQSMQNINNIAYKYVSKQHGVSKDANMQPLSRTDAAIKLAKSVGLDTSLYITTPPLAPLRKTKSTDTISISDGSYHFEQGKTFVELPYGRINFSVTYYQKNKRLVVYIENVESLACKYSQEKYYIFLKLCILPNDRIFRTSQVLKPETDYKSGEDFYFTLKDPVGKVLRISAYEYGMQGKYDAIGHTLLELEESSDGKPKSYIRDMHRKSEATGKLGSLYISTSYTSSTQKLTMEVIQASKLNIKHILKDKPTDKSTTYVKVAYFYAGHKMKTKKSPLTTYCKNITTYNHKASFKVTEKTMNNCYMVVTVMVKSHIHKDYIVGRYILGPFFYTFSGALTPWGKVLLKEETETQWYQLYL